MQERTQKFYTAFNPMTVLIFLPVEAVVSMLCSNQIPFRQGGETPGLPKEITNKCFGFFSKIVLALFVCLFVCLGDFIILDCDLLLCHAISLKGKT